LKVAAKFQVIIPEARPRPKQTACDITILAGVLQDTGNTNVIANEPTKKATIMRTGGYEENVITQREEKKIIRERTYKERDRSGNN